MGGGGDQSPAHSSPVEDEGRVQHVEEKRCLVGGKYLEEAEHLCHYDAGDDQQVAYDDGGTRSAEEVAQEEGQHHLGMSPQQEHHRNDHRVGLERR